MAPSSSTLASLDEALTSQRIRLERILFRLVVARLARKQGVAPDTRDRFWRRLEAEVEMSSMPSEAREEAESAIDGVARTAARAPEPYRTMLNAQLERLERIQREMHSGEGTPTSDDSLDALAAEVGYRAARGTLAGAVAGELAAFLRSRDARSTVA